MSLKRFMVMQEGDEDLPSIEKKHRDGATATPTRSSPTRSPRIATEPPPKDRIRVR